MAETTGKFRHTTNNFVNNYTVFGKTVRAQVLFSFHKELHNLSFRALNVHNLEEYYKRCNEKSRHTR